VYFDSQNKIKSFCNPIDYIEEQFYKFDVDLFRDSPNHLTLNYRGQWRSYNVVFVWDEQNKIISVSSHFDITKKEKINKDIYSLVSTVNEKINLGYFHYCSKLDTVFFKYQVSVKGFDFLTEEQIDDILNVVIKECDKYFPAFYLFFFKKQDPKYALSASLIETNGQA
tara:strand:+ start:433 stop:936 length:504 start_codon:yes stop_codon:yes gene_type:complete